jgi:hypothetical protein
VFEQLVFLRLEGLGTDDSGICKIPCTVTADLIPIQFQRGGFQPFTPVSTRQLILERKL